MDPLAVGTAVFVLVFVLLAVFGARANAGKPLSEFGARERMTPQSGTSSAELDEQDLSEMLAVTNARRRSRGLPERTVSDAAREFGVD